jgi:hypothetical protein
VKSVLAYFLLAASMLWAQGNNATIVGSVSDPSGAVMPGVAVVATNVNTNVRSSVVTDGSGNFQIPNLQPGMYQVEVQSTGFKRFIRQNVSLEIDRQLRLNAVLEPGAVSESVNVSAEAPLVQTETGALSTTMETRQVASLPLLGRNPQELKALIPGVARNRDGDVVAQGGMVRKDPYYIDGAHSSNHVWGGTPVNPNPDVVAEVKVMTNSFSAEYGQASGAVMMATTKSGTNDLHGTLFEFFRNNKMNAGNYYTHQIPVLRFNQFGGTIGGPVIKSKTFFFLATQLSRQRNQTVFSNVTLPLAAFKQGDFSSVLGAQVGTDALNRPVFRNQIFDPATARTVKNSAGVDVVVRDAFPNNRIPTSRFSPAAVRLQSIFPLPQANSVAANYNSVGTNKSDVYSYDMKVDHIFNESNRIMGRYSREQSDQENAMLFDTVTGGGPNFGPLITNPGYQAVLNYIHVFGGASTNDLHLSYFRRYPHRYPAGYGVAGLSDYGISGLPNATEKLGTPLIDFAGTGSVTSIGSPSGTLLLEKQESFALVNISSLIRGKHTIKFGGEVRRLRTDNIQPQPDNGRFTFNNLFTDQRGFNNTGYDYASFLLGLPSNFTYEIYPGFISPRGSVYALFVQDDIRVARNLTINIGLRWDAPLYWSERKNRSGIFSLDKGRFVQFGTEGFRTSLHEQDWLNIGPRFGFAWTPVAGGNTVLRGGYGLFTLSQQGFGQSGGLPRQPIFADADAGRFATVDQVTPRATLDSIPWERANVTGSNALSVSIYPDKNPIGYFQQWNFNVEHQLGSMLVEVGYAGSKGAHLPYGGYNLNAIGPEQASAARGQFVAPYVPYPQYPNGVTVQSSIGSSYYHALQMKAERRFSAGLAFLAAYTWQRTMAVGDQGYRDPVNNRNLDRGVEANSTPHRFTIGYNYELPFGRGKRWVTGGVANQVLGGWEINGITTLQSGFPLVFASNVNTCQCGVTNRPNVAFDPRLGSSERTTERYFNVDAFSIPAQYQIGNAGRGLVYGPGLMNHDVNIGKRFFVPKLPERSNVEFRGEIYNLTNTPYFNNPNTSIGTATAGRITGVADTSRRMQLGLKLNF